MQIVELLEVRQPSDAAPPYTEALGYLLGQPVAPSMGFFMTNVALYAGKLSPLARDESLKCMVDSLLTRAKETEDLGCLTGLAVALLQAASSISDVWVNTIHDKIQEIDGVYYRVRSDGSGIWTIGLAWEKPMIIQIDTLSEYRSVQRITLALALYLLANGKALGEVVQRLGGNLEEGLRFFMCTEGDYETYILQGKSDEACVTPEYPVTVMESAVPWGEPQPPACIILHDDFEQLADLSNNFDTRASQLLLAQVTLDFIAHCTHLTREAVKDSLSIVREAFY